MESLINQTTLTFKKDHIYDFFEEILDRVDVLKTTKNEIIQRAFINGLESLSNKELHQVKTYLTLYSTQNTCPVCKNKNIKFITDFIYVSDFGMCPVCDYESDTYII